MKNFPSCKNCGKKLTDYRNRYCIKCFQLGNRNPLWQNGISLKKYYCKKCGKLLSNYSVALNSGLCFGCIGSYISKKNTGRIMSVKTRKKISKSHIGLHTGKKNPMYGKQTHGNFGIYKGTFMRSSYELNFAKWLDLSEIAWQYEPSRFNLGNTTYTPDFYLPEFDCWIEIKGWWHPKNLRKFRKFKSQWKEINLKVFDSNVLQEMGIIK